MKTKIKVLKIMVIVTIGYAIIMLTVTNYKLRIKNTQSDRKIEMLEKAKKDIIQEKQDLQEEKKANLR